MNTDTGIYTDTGIHEDTGIWADTGIPVLIEIPVYTGICRDIVISFLYRYRPVLIQIPEYRNYTDTGLNKDTKRNTVLKKKEKQTNNASIL